MITNAAISPDAATQSSTGLRRDRADRTAIPHGSAERCPTRWRYRIAVLILAFALLVALSDRNGYAATLRGFIESASLLGAGVAAVCFVVLALVIAL